MQEETYMVCLRVDELDTPVEGSTTTACVDCGDDIWISAASRKKMGQAGAMPLCSRCAIRVAQTSETRPIVGDISDAQLDEMMEEMRTKHPELMEIIDNDTDNFEAMKATAVLAGQHMTNPSDDWGSMVLIEDWDGVLYPPIPLSEILSKGIPKDVVAKQLLPACVQAAQAKRVFIGMSSWTLVGKEFPSGPICDHPDREEALVIVDITADGVQRMSRAAILRDGVSPPKLGEWDNSEDTSSFDGLFVEAIVPTLQLVRTLRSG